MAEFRAELDHFIDMTELEQRHQLSAHIPSAADYLSRRLGTGAVGVCLPANEYSLSSQSRLEYLLTLSRLDFAGNWKFRKPQGICQACSYCRKQPI